LVISYINTQSVNLVGYYYFMDSNRSISSSSIFDRDVVLFFRFLKLIMLIKTTSTIILKYYKEYFGR